MGSQPPKISRTRRTPPVRGDWVHAPAPCWRHGPVPPPPDGISEGATQAWNVWFSSWPSSFWTPGDLPGLWILVRMYDRARSDKPGKAGAATEWRLLADNYGLTPKGQQDRRWLPPLEAEQQTTPARTRPSNYQHLRVVLDEGNQK